MTLAYPIPRQDRQSDIFTGDATATYGPFDYKIFDVADVEVWTCAAGENSFSLQPSVLVTKTNNLPFDSFSVTFPATQPATTKIVVRSARLDERSAGVMGGTSINPDALEKEFSKLSTETQELRRDVNRGLKSEFGQDALTLDADIVDGDTLMKSGARIVKGPNAALIATAEGYATDAIALAEASADAAKGFRDETAILKSQTVTAATQAAQSLSQAQQIVADLNAVSYSTIGIAAAATIPSTAPSIKVGGQPYGRVDSSFAGFGPELITNGDASSSTGWTLGSGWAISGGILSKTGAAVSSAVQSVATSGAAYFVKFDVTARTAGGVRSQAGNGAGSFGAVRTSVGSYNDILVNSGSLDVGVCTTSGDFVGSVDNVSAKALPAGSFKNTASGEWWAPTGSVSAVLNKLASVSGNGNKVPMVNNAGTDYNYVPARDLSVGFNVKNSQFGAVGDGVTDDTAAFQAFFNAIKNAAGAKGIIPEGRFKTTATTGYTAASPGTASIVLEGVDPMLSMMEYRGSGHCFNFSMGQNTYRTTNRSAFRKIGFSGKGGMAADSGAVINVDRVGASSIVPGNLFEDIYVGQDDGTRWLYGFRASNSQEQWFNRCYIMFVNNELGAAIQIENSLTQPSFGAFVRDCAINGGGYGLRATGWIESVIIDGGGMAGCVECVSLDATGFPQGAPHFEISNLHLNGKKRDIHTVAWRTIMIHDVDLYQGVGSGDIANENNVMLEYGSKAIISGNKIEMVSGGRTGILVNNFQDVNIGGNIMKNVTGTGVAVLGGQTKKVMVHNNQIDRGGAQGDSGIYVAGIDGSGCVKVNDNMIDGFGTGVNVAANNSSVTNNLLLSCATKVSLSGTNATQSGNV